MVGTRYRHRIVEFEDDEGKKIRVITNLMYISAETVTPIDKERWIVEVFCKWLKQQMNLATIFGNSPNVVYHQHYGRVRIILCKNKSWENGLMIF